MIEKLCESPESLRLIAVVSLAAFAGGCLLLAVLLICRERRARWLERKINQINRPGGRPDGRE